MADPKSDPKADPRIYVALDLPTLDEALAMVATLGDSCVSYKIGLQLLPLGGADLAAELSKAGLNVFADFKLHDIGATVEKATRSITTLGVDLLTVHARPEVMAAAARGAEGSDLKVLGVTVLTSLDGAALRSIGYGYTAKELVRRRAEQAVEAGIAGVVASPLEAEMIREVVPSDFLVVCPGVRPIGSAQGDQKRVATPSDALAAGASHLVIGRPVTQADDPKAAMEAILAGL